MHASMGLPMKDKPHNSSRFQPDAEFSLEVLAQKSGVAERTIRYYITRGLLAGPARGGRSAFYTDEHLKRLEEIRRNQRQGRTLGEIERSGESAALAHPLPEPETWWAYPLAPDVVVQVRSGTSPWRTRQIRTALEQLAHLLSPR
jgi:DNA-binding transcriptional MerR regulator